MCRDGDSEETYVCPFLQKPCLSSLPISRAYYVLLLETTGSREDNIFQTEELNTTNISILIKLNWCSGLARAKSSSDVLRREIISEV